MASPQIEDGYTRIANELLDALFRFDFSKRQYKVVLYVIRRTYGFHKTKDIITNGEIAEATGLNRRNVISTISELVEMNVLQVEKSGVSVRGGEVSYVGINKRYTLWATGADSTLVTSVKTATGADSTLVSKQSATSVETDTRLVSKQHPLKEIRKEREKKEEPASADAPPLANESKTKRRGKKVTLPEFADGCRERGEKIIPEDDPIFVWADSVSLPHDWLRICWLEFSRKSQESGKTYIDWRAAFRDCVRRNWYRLWYAKPDGEMGLTTTGVLLMRELENAA